MCKPFTRCGHNSTVYQDLVRYIVHVFALPLHHDTHILSFAIASKLNCSAKTVRLHDQMVASRMVGRSDLTNSIERERERESRVSAVNGPSELVFTFLPARPAPSRPSSVASECRETVRGRSICSHAGQPRGREGGRWLRWSVGRSLWISVQLSSSHAVIMDWIPEWSGVERSGQVGNVRSLVRARSPGWFSP